MLLAASASLVSALPAAQADLDVLAMNQQPIAGSISPLGRVSDLVLGADSSWAASARVGSAAGGDDFVIVGDASSDGSAGASVLRRPSTASSPPTLRLGRPSILGGQLAYLGSDAVVPVLRYNSAWLDGQLLAEQGGPLGSTGRTWVRFTGVLLRPGGKVFLRGTTSSGAVLYAHHSDTVLLSVGDPVATMGTVLRIERVQLSPNGEHWIARVAVGFGLEMLLVDGLPLSVGGASVVEGQSVGAGLGLGNSTWSSFGRMAVDDDGRATFQAAVFGDSNGELTIRGDRVIQPISTVPPFLDFRGNAFGSLAIASSAEAIFLEGEPIVTGAATLDVDGDGLADAGYTLGTNPIGGTDWLPLGSSNGFIGTVFVDVPNSTGDRQAVVRFQRSLQSTDVCDGVANSTGRPATLGAVGRSSASANDLSLFCIDLPAGCMGYAIASQQAGFVMNPGGSDGNLCLGGSVGRVLDQMFTIGEAGRGTVTLDLSELPQPTGAVAAMSGDIWFFQVWHRDTCATGATSNFSNAVSVQFTN